MKVQFMKKLVPLALITSIAVTNVGITSVAAQTPTNAITQSVEGPVAVENESVSVGETATTTVKLTTGQLNAIKQTNDLNTLANGTKFKYTYAYGTTEDPKDNQEASVLIKLPINDADNALPSDFEGKSSLFSVTKASGAALATGESASVVVRPISTETATPNGGVQLEVSMNYKLASTLFANATDADKKFEIHAKASDGTDTLIGTFTLVKYDSNAGTGNYEVKEAPRFTFAENTKGEAVKYKLVKTSATGVKPEGYDLVSYKAYEMTDGSFVYPGELEALGQIAAAPYTSIPNAIKDDPSYDGQVVATLTPAQVAALPYTTKTPATYQEYVDLTGGAKISGKSKDDLDKAVTAAVDAKLAKAAEDYAASLEDGATEAEKKAGEEAVKLFDSIIAGLGETPKSNLENDAKNVIKTNTGNAYDAEIALAKKNTLYGVLNDSEKNGFLAAHGSGTSNDSAFKAGAEVSGTSYNTWLSGLAVDATDDDMTDLKFIQYLASLGASASDFATQLNGNVTNAANKVWNCLITTYGTQINALDWIKDSSLEDTIKKLKYDQLVTKIGTLDTTTHYDDVDYLKDSEYVTKTMLEAERDTLLKNEYAHQEELDTASINWITETVNAKGDLASGAGFAKFAVTKNDKTSFAAKTTGDSVIVGATKANKQTNSYVIVKAVSKNYKAATAKTAQKGDVYAQAEFYVTPVASTGFTEKSLSTTAEKPGITFSAPASDAANNNDKKTYTLKLDEGKSYKLPFALKDGADKTLVYDVQTGAKGFTVVNGTVKAIAGDCQGDIIVRPAATPNAWADESRVDKPENATALRVHVETNTTVKQIKANANNVTMYPGATQYISFGTNPASFGTYTYEITGVEGYKSATFVDGVGGTPNQGTPTNNTVLKLEAFSASEIAADETKQPAKTVKATVKIKKGNDEVDVKEFPLTIKWAGAGANAKTVKETYKKVNSDGVVEINVPVGGVVNLGASVNPATADQSIKYIAANNDSDNGLKAIKSVKNLYGTVTDAQIDTTTYSANVLTTELTMTGDVIKAVTPGTYYVKGWTAAKNEKGDNLTTNIYKINVYTPGASIIMNDGRDADDGFTYENYGAGGAREYAQVKATKDSVYTIVGGNLMTKAAAETDGNKTIMGGQTITIAEPYTLGTSEEIEWKCNKPSAIRITKGKNYQTAKSSQPDYTASTAYNSEEYSTLDLDLMQAGTFTITGTTKYTKQKFVFKVNVGADATIKRDQTPTCEKFYFDYNGTAVDLLNSGSPVADGATKMKVKDTASVGFFTNKVGLNGTVKYEAVDKKVLNVAANGTVKALAKGSTAIKATFTSADKKTTFTVTSPKITVEPQTATISKFTIPSGVSIGKDFNVSAAIKDAKIADCTVTWDYLKLANKAAADAINDSNYKNQVTNASWSLGNKPSGKVKLTEDGYYFVKLTVAPKNDTDPDHAVSEWGIIQAFAKTPTIVNVNNNDADAKKAIAALAAAPKAGEEEGTTVGGAGYGVYIIPVFAADKDGNLTATNVGDIEWTSSNVSLATAEAVSIDTANNQSVKDFLDKVNADDTSTTNMSGSVNNKAQNTFKEAVEEENAIVKSAANAAGLVKIVTASANSGLTGKVTLTGVLKNSGKKVTVTLNIKNEAKKVVDKYNPIEVTHGNASATLDASNGFQNIVALKGDEYDKDAVNKLKKGATYTYYAYALVDTTDAKLLKAKPADHIKAINTAGASSQDKLTYTSTDGKYSVSKILAAATTNATAGDTYYLAQVAVSVKVKTAAELDEDGSVKTGGDAVLETTPTKQVITIASQTPVIIK